MRLQEWRQRGEWVTLPSGLEVRFVEVNLLDLAMQGAIPAPLMGLVNQIIEGGDIEVTVEDFAKMAPVINNLVKLGIVEPPVADAPDEEHLGVEELPALDRLFLFNYMNREAKGLEPFRAEAAKPVESAQPGEGIRDAAKFDFGVEGGELDGVPVGPGDADGGTVDRMADTGEAPD